MLRRLSELVRPKAARSEDPEHARRLAKTVLLLEVARADFDLHEAQQETIRHLLAQRFGLRDAEVDALLDTAGERARASVSLHQFIDTLNAQLSQDDKRMLMEMVWRVIYADGRVDPNEEHLARRLADLLHLSHSDFIRAKLAVADDKDEG